MKAFSLLCASITCTLIACGGDPPADESDPGGTIVEAADGLTAPIRDAFDTEPVSGANYGDGVSAAAEPLPFPQFMSTVREQGTLTAVVRGEVVKVCQNKGCWMTLQPGQDQVATAASEEMTVRFKDYGFFMPKDLAGHVVLAEGTARRRMVPVEELRHYAEDAGESAERIAEITEPEEELEFVATGVRVL